MKIFSHTKTIHALQIRSILCKCKSFCLNKSSVERNQFFVIGKAQAQENPNKKATYLQFFTIKNLFSHQFLNFIGELKILLDMNKSYKETYEYFIFQCLNISKRNFRFACVSALDKFRYPEFD